MDWNGRNGCDALNCTVCRRGTFFNRNWNFPPHEKVRGLNYRRPGHYQSINLYHCITLYMLLLGMTYKRSEKGADNTGLSCFHVMQHWSIILHIPYKVLQSTCYSEFGVRSRQGLQDYEYSVHCTRYSSSAQLTLWYCTWYYKYNISIYSTVLI